MAVTDMLSGAVSFMFDSVAASLPLIQAGKVRALAVASSTAVPAVPNLPTVTQAGVSGYDVDNWFGIYARARRRRSICWPRPRPRC
jgi:tripartite-type tricarboxylate transporter receptor subunit TctC